MTLGHSAVSPFSVDFLSASLEFSREAHSHLVVVVVNVVVIVVVVIINQHILSGQRADSSAVRVGIYNATSLEDLGTEAHEKVTGL